MFFPEEKGVPGREHPLGEGMVVDRGGESSRILCWLGHGAADEVLDEKAERSVSPESRHECYLFGSKGEASIPPPGGLPGLLSQAHPPGLGST